VIPEVKPETKSLTKKMIDMVLKRKEQTRIFRDLRETISIALEAMKYEILDENTLKQTLKEIAEVTTKRPCDIIKHPTTTVKELLNTPNIKIQQSQITRTVACREIKPYEIFEVSTTFTIETIEIQTTTKKYIIVTNVIEVKPSY
jgi:hypothetical protein